jgi:hypothetical protein
VKFAAVAGHRSSRAMPSLRNAPQRQSMETTGREAIYRHQNAVQTKPPPLSAANNGSGRMMGSLVAGAGFEPAAFRL